MDRKISRAFMAMVFMFCFFLIGTCLCICEKVRILECKIESYTGSCKSVIEQVEMQREADRRILEQNTVLITEININKE